MEIFVFLKKSLFTQQYELYPVQRTHPQIQYLQQFSFRLIELFDCFSILVFGGHHSDNDSEIFKIIYFICSKLSSVISGQRRLLWNVCATNFCFAHSRLVKSCSEHLQFGSVLHSSKIYYISFNPKLTKQQIAEHKTTSITTSTVKKNEAFKILTYIRNM